MSPPRILVTGSRDWTDRDVIYRALVSAWDRTGRHPAAVLVQGECHLGGADAIAADVWASWGLPVEGHPQFVSQIYVSLSTAGLFKFYCSEWG